MTHVRTICPSALNYIDDFAFAAPKSRKSSTGMLMAVTHLRLARFAQDGLKDTDSSK